MNETEFEKLLSSFQSVINNYVDMSLQVREGKIAAEDAIRAFDSYIAPAVLLVTMISASRGQGPLAGLI